MATGPLQAGVVEQTLADVFPNRLRAVEPQRVGLLDLDGSAAPAAGDPQQMPVDIASRCVRIGLAAGLISAPASAMTVCQYSGGISSPGPNAGVGMCQLAGWSAIPN
ncbi:MAG TPA: hypothetical protein VHC94_12935 [Nitrobacter sp.]|jgi:hypothetical protein|nr:hypothetical protein [Nitrobacter sp.]